MLQHDHMHGAACGAPTAWNLPPRVQTSHQRRAHRDMHAKCNDRLPGGLVVAVTAWLEAATACVTSEAWWYNPRAVRPMCTMSWLRILGTHIGDTGRQGRHRSPIGAAEHTLRADRLE